MALSTHRSRKSLNASRPAIEPLEARAYLSSSLTVTIPSVLPASEIAGVKIKENISVNLANDGPTVHGPLTISLFASTDTTLLSNAVEFAQQKFSGATIAEGKNKTFTVKVKSYPLNLNNNYYVLADVTPGNVVGTSSTYIEIIPPQINLSGAVAPPPHNGHIGHKVALTVSVTNNGNVPANGNLPVDFAASISTNGSSPYNLGSLSKQIHIKPGRTQVLHFSLPLPLGMPSGNQYIVATVDPTDVFNESNLGNNTSVSASPVSVT